MNLTSAYGDTEAKTKAAMALVAVSDFAGLGLAGVQRMGVGETGHGGVEGGSSGDVRKSLLF